MTPILRSSTMSSPFQQSITGIQYRLKIIINDFTALKKDSSNVQKIMQSFHKSADEISTKITNLDEETTEGIDHLRMIPISFIVEFDKTVAQSASKNERICQ